MHVEEVMKSMNYQPNVLARSLKQERTRTVGIILPDMTNSYFMTVARRVRLTSAGERLSSDLYGFRRGCGEGAGGDSTAPRDAD